MTLPLTFRESVRLPEAVTKTWPARRGAQTCGVCWGLRAARDLQNSAAAANVGSFEPRVEV